MTYVLDACALVAFFNQETEGIKVKELLEHTKAGKHTLYKSIVNLVEVYYHFIRDRGKMAADELLENMKYLPIEVIDTISEAVYRQTAHFKSHYHISLADAFACAAAQCLDATLVTKDSEVEEAEEKEALSVFWIK
ncbi:hypothetical protein AGMMS49546_36620 [Spirochaetia bacterium]|nr:hypothetical protein AGMMS49546_36620 [Spirochaetia bacterium]